MADNTRNLRELNDEQQVREKPAVIFGTNDEYGAAHGVYEVIANSVDEAREGYGDLIRVSMFKDGSVEVIDSGRGIPMGWNEELQKYNWEIAFCKLYGSGKYDSSSYSSALGTNGLGLTAMQYASEFMTAESTYNGKTHIVHFKEGRPLGDMQVIPANRDGTGTLIKFKPDKKVFVNLEKKALPAEYFINLLSRQAMLIPGLKIKFYHHEFDDEITLHYPEGASDFLEKIADGHMLSESVHFKSSKTGVDDPEQNPEPYTVNMNITFNFSRDGGFLELYHNNSHLFEATKNYSLNGFKKGITEAFDDHAKELGKIGKSEGFNFKDIESLLLCVGTTDAPGHRTFFRNQTKGAINNPLIIESFTSFVYNSMRTWLNNERKESDKVLKEVITNKTAREEADKVSKKVVRSLGSAVTFKNKPKKFSDCSTKEVAERELYIVEGDSALGSVKLARNPEFQAVIPVRGKIINCLKERLSRVLNSDIIIDLFRVLECGIEAESKYIKDLPKFDLNKLNWGKIIICTDADLDGMHIRCLLITMLYVLAPSLLKANKVYIAETPLYEIIYKKEVAFAYSDEERDQMIQILEDNGISRSQLKINRSKGLGENDADMMAKSTMNPKTRRLIPIKYPEDDSGLKELFEALLGNDIESRRVLINEYFDQTEVSID